jgi:hypothetical protein
LYVTLREEYRFRVFEDRVLRINLEIRGRKWQRNGEYCIMGNLVITFTLHEIFLG